MDGQDRHSHSSKQCPNVLLIDGNSRAFAKSSVKPGKMVDSQYIYMDILTVNGALSPAPAKQWRPHLLCAEHLMAAAKALISGKLLIETGRTAHGVYYS